jgi:antitoxin component YwqK of YwqJK toxin-antitoxin module
MRFAVYICVCFYAVATMAQTVDANGKKQGYWKKRDEKTNHLIYEGAFKNDKPVGLFKYYYPHDTVRATLFFRADGKTVSAKLFHLNGKRMAEGNYLEKEIKDSVWTYYDEDGRLISREKYVAGKKQGPSTVYLPDGKVSEETQFKNGLENGPYIKYFDGLAVRSKGQYVNGNWKAKTRTIILMVWRLPQGITSTVEKMACGFIKIKTAQSKKKNFIKTGYWRPKRNLTLFSKKLKTTKTHQSQQQNPRQ